MAFWQFWLSLAEMGGRAYNETSWLNIKTKNIYRQKYHVVWNWVVGHFEQCSHLAPSGAAWYKLGHCNVVLHSQRIGVKQIAEMCQTMKWFFITFFLAQPFSKYSPGKDESAHSLSGLISFTLYLLQQYESIINAVNRHFKYVKLEEIFSRPGQSQGQTWNILQSFQSRIVF